jgi:hypothetical protein
VTLKKGPGWNLKGYFALVIVVVLVLVLEIFMGAEVEKD